MQSDRSSDNREPYDRQFWDIPEDEAEDIDAGEGQIKDHTGQSIKHCTEDDFKEVDTIFIELEEIVLDLNTKGLGYLKMEDMEASLHSLKQAERFLVSALRSGMKKNGTLKLLAVTLNNLACYYKRYHYLIVQNKVLPDCPKIPGQSPADRKNRCQGRISVCCYLSEYKRYTFLFRQAFRSSKVR